MKRKYTLLGLITIIIIVIGLINRSEKFNGIAVYLDNVESTSIPDKNSNYLIDNIICDNDTHATWDNDSWDLIVTNITKKTNCKLHFRSKKDITITYDSNYIKNNIIDDIYELTSFSRNVIISINTNYSISKKMVLITILLCLVMTKQLLAVLVDSIKEKNH